MSSPIYEHLIGELAKAGITLTDDGNDLRAWLTRHIHLNHYSEIDLVRSPEGATMSLATFEATIKDDVATGLAKAEALVEHFKTVAEQHLPELAALQSSPVVKALEGFILPPAAEAFIADMVATLASKYGQPASTVAPSAPAEPVADPAPAQ